MANNPYKNKVIYNGTTLLDLTGDTVAPDKLLLGYTAHDASGAPITGTATAGGAITVVDTPDSHGGTIRTITAVSLENDTVAPEYLLEGYTAHDSTGQAIVGTATGGGSSPTLQSKSVTPTESAQTVVPDSGYDGLSSVSVGAISSSYVGSGVTTKAAATITPGTTDQTIASGTYLTGAQTISGDADLVAGNIKKDVQIFGVTGTYEGSSGNALTLLKTTSLGALSTSSTSATNTNKTMTVTGYNDYDVLIVDVSVDSTTNNRHTSTVSMVYLTGTSSVDTKNTYAVGSNKWNSKLSSTGAGSTRQSTTAYGIYVNEATVSSSTMTLTFYYRYNNNNTGTINGNYTARVYGVKLYDLIGG